VTKPQAPRVKNIVAPRAISTNRRHRAATLICALLGVATHAAAAAATAAPRASTTEASRDAVTEFARLLFVAHDPAQAFQRYFSPHLIQHDAEIGDGNHGDDDFLAKRRKAHPEQFLAAEKYATVVDNILADGELVAIKSHVYTHPKDRGRVFVDIWRVAGGQFVEHWDVIQTVPETVRNEATMWCGKASTYTEAQQTGDTVEHPTCGPAGPQSHRSAALAIVTRYMSMGEDPRRSAEAVRMFVADDFVQHSPHIPQGKQALIEYFVTHAQERAAAGRSSELARVLADGDFVLTHRRVTSKQDRRGVAYADLLRVRDGKIVEHWDVVQPIPPFSVAGHSMVIGPLEPDRTASSP